jgi:hypothetical protein
MYTALVIMTILGCDDSVTDCSYVATLKQRWRTVEQCNAVSDKELAKFANVSYPVVIAVCQDPAVTEAKAAADVAKAHPVPSTVPKPEPQSPEETRAEEQSLGRKAIERAKALLPSAESVHRVVTKPVRIAEDGYSWVIKRLH